MINVINIALRQEGNVYLRNTLRIQTYALYSKGIFHIGYKIVSVTGRDPPVQTTTSDLVWLSSELDSLRTLFRGWME
jgi:hypothetical protein